MATQSTITTNLVAAGLIIERAQLLRDNKSTKIIDKAIAKELQDVEWDAYTGEETKDVARNS